MTGSGALSGPVVPLDAPEQFAPSAAVVVSSRRTFAPVTPLNVDLSPLNAGIALSAAGPVVDCSELPPELSRSHWKGNVEFAGRPAVLPEPPEALVNIPCFPL